MSGPQDAPPWGQEQQVQLPAAVEAEHAVLGAALYDNEAYQLVEDLLKGEHFYEPLHGRIWDAIAAEIRKGKRAEPIGVGKLLGDDEAFIEVGGIAFLGLLVDRAPGPQDAHHYASIVADMAMRRAVANIGKEIFSKALTLSTSLTGMEQVIDAERSLAQLALSGPQKQTFERIGPIYRRQLLRSRGLNGATPGYSTGIPSLDAILGGLRPATMNTIAARPGMGKSAVAIEIAKNLALNGIAVAFYSAEMPEEQVATRFGCSLVYDRNAPLYNGKTSNPTYEDFEKGELTELQWANLEKGLEILETLPIFIDFRRPTVSYMQATTRRLQRSCAKDGIDKIVVIVDHMLKVKSELIGRMSNPTAEVTQVSNDSLEAAKSLNLPWVNLMQLNRGVEGREDKRPGLSDLKLSGAIEEDSYSVSFLMRPEYYNRPPEDDDDEKGWKAYQKIKDRWTRKLLWLLEKNRGGRGQQQLELFCDIGCNVIQDLKLANPDSTGNLMFPTGGDVFDQSDYGSMIR